MRQAGDGHDAACEDAQGASVVDVVVRGAGRDLIVLTFDRDYGERIFRGAAPRPACLLYLRFRPRTPTEAADVVLGLLATGALDLLGKSTVVERDQVRQRALP